MYVLGIVGDSARAVADDLAEQFGGDGRVAVVSRDPPETENRAPGDARFRLGDGGWTASGRDRPLPELLDDLAPEYDYVVLADLPDADVPQVVVGDAEGRGEPLVEAADPSAVDPAEVRSSLEATEPYETLESLVAAAKRSADAPFSGAIATFTGRVRAKEDADDEPTEYLEFEKYEGVAEERTAAIESELEDREGVFDVLLYHRTGVIEYGEDIVFVVVLAGHREEAFRTVEDGINRLKDEVPIFKKEVTTDEQFWVHEQS
jgi:molybdopterin synthase catalytic subunit